MAKKASKKAAKKSATKSAVKKPATKVAAKKATAKTGSSMGPVPVDSGRGATPFEIGKDLVTKFNAGKFEIDEIGHFSDAMVSCEGLGVGLEWRGRKAVDTKNADWYTKHKIHGASAEGPYVGSTGFSVKFNMDVEVKETGQRMAMMEIGVYTVKDGKIVREEFMYGTMKG
jgi:hypothetical protein